MKNVKSNLKSTLWWQELKSKMSKPILTVLISTLPLEATFQMSVHFSNLWNLCQKSVFRFLKDGILTRNMEQKVKEGSSCIASILNEQLRWKLKACALYWPKAMISVWQSCMQRNVFNVHRYISSNPRIDLPTDNCTTLPVVFLSPSEPLSI